MYAALLIAQRAILAREGSGNPTDYLPTFHRRLRNALRIVGKSEPTPGAIADALKEFEILTMDELAAWAG
jgi:hypothetical protein